MIQQTTVVDQIEDGIDLINNLELYSIIVIVGLIVLFLIYKHGWPWK